MDIQEEKEGAVDVLTPHGRLDTQNADEFEVSLLRKIELGARLILIDCSDLDYMNSAGLKAFLLAAKKLQPLGGKIILCAMAPNVYMVFELTGFNSLFVIKPTRREALLEFN